jgi:hypothetical protein
LDSGWCEDAKMRFLLNKPDKSLLTLGQNSVADIRVAVGLIKVALTLKHKCQLHACQQV